MAHTLNKSGKTWFDQYPTIRHWSGYTFQQRGGRVYIEDEGTEIDSITSNDLQATIGLVLSFNELRKLAVTWLEDNRPEALK